MRIDLRVCLGWLAMAGLGGVVGCDSPVQPLSNGLPRLAGPFIVSSPVPSLVAPALSVRSAAATAVSTVVYISLRPGAMADGVSASIRNLDLGSSVTVRLVNGGFDPVALPAVGGDSIAVDVRTVTGAVRPYGFNAILRARPTVVRTDPPGNKRDVSLNALVVMVFSVPIDETTLNGSTVQLWQGTTPVAGTVQFADSTNLRAEFHPDTLLAPQTDYQLIATQGITDLNGLALDSALTVPFTTGSTPPATNLVFASVSAGNSYTCGVTTGGAAYCWGDNFAGQLGNGTTASSATPVPVAGGLTFAAVSAMYFHTCGVTTAGALYCWGGGWSGAPIGVHPPGAGSTPEPVGGGLTFATLSTGAYHACGVTTAGAAYCWGEASSGQLGDGTTWWGVTVAAPVAVAGGLTFASVSAGVYSTCGVTTTGAAYCWGNNMLGGLGTGTSTGPETCSWYSDPFAACSTVPVAVAGGLTFTQVEAKVYAACGVTTSGTTYCWGSNLNDALGFGTHTGPEQCAWSESYIVPCILVPAVVPGVTNLISLSASEEYTCGLTPAGEAYCWGYPQGLGDLSSNTGPVAVPGGLTFATLSAGPYTTCGVTPAGVAYCWGDNSYGELGTGTTTSSSVPVKVAGQP